MITAWVTVSPSLASASCFIFWSTIADASGGEYFLPPIITWASPLECATTLNGTRPMSLCTLPSLKRLPMNRLTEKTVLSGLVTACRLAVVPTYLSPLRAFTPTTEGSGAGPLRVLDDLRLSPLDHGHARVGCSEVYSYDSGHLCSSCSVLSWESSSSSLDTVTRAGRSTLSCSL